jgi:hypothetical protein
MLHAVHPIFQYHIFVSYRSHDSEYATQLTQLLQTLGLRVWLDRDPGQYDKAHRSSSDPRGRPIAGDEDAILDVLNNAIAYSIFLLVITSSHTLGSIWIRREIELARQLEKPLFFWHLSYPEEGERVSIRHGGLPPPPEATPKQFLEAIAPDYKEEYLASSASLELMETLSQQEGLNILGHHIGPPSHIGGLCLELNEIVEMSELALSDGKSLCADALLQSWREYKRLCDHARELERTIAERFGRTVNVGRIPMGNAFRLKRPFVKTRIQHLTRLVEDRAFREQEFNKGDA